VHFLLQTLQLDFFATKHFDGVFHGHPLGEGGLMSTLRGGGHEGNITEVQAGVWRFSAPSGTDALSK
jgi:hypothetical protein